MFFPHGEVYRLDLLMCSPAGLSYPTCAERLAVSEALRSSNGWEACVVWRHADVTDSHWCTPLLPPYRQPAIPVCWDVLGGAVLQPSPDTRCTWHAPGGVQKFYLTGEHLFTYAVL